MTTPGGPPASAREGGEPHTGHPSWGPQPPVAPGWGPAGPRPPVMEARDGTARTVATIALVVGGLAVLAQLAVVLLPALLFGGLLWGMDEGWVEEGPMSTATFTGRVVPGAAGSVSATALQDAVVRHGGETGALDGTPGELRCDDVPRVTPDVSVLCRATGGERWYAVIRFTDGDGAFEVTVLEDFGDAW